MSTTTITAPFPVSDAHLASAIGHAPTPCYLIDREHRIVWANRAYCEFSLRNYQDLLGTCPALVHSSIPFEEVIRALDSGDQSWVGTVVEDTPEGGVVVVEATITAIPPSPDNPQSYYLIIEHDITARQAESERMEHHLNHDRLTGIANRSMFAVMADLAINQSKRHGQRAALLYIDLDGFKPVNDIHGHDYGDKVLIQAAQILKDTIRSSDVAARLGGDEFAVVLFDVGGVCGACGVASNIIKRLQQPMTIDGVTINIGASIGVACYPTDGLSYDALRTRADEAMYQAKRAGKNCWMPTQRTVEQQGFDSCIHGKSHCGAGKQVFELFDATDGMLVQHIDDHLGELRA